jgi:hypothetical protein
VRFRRRSADDDEQAAAAEDSTSVPEGPRARGPWDVSEVGVDEGDDQRVDLGSLLVRPREGLDVQLQVDEASGTVVAALLAGEQGAVELRVFAAPRNGDIWDDLRRTLRSEVAQLGGTATESEGPFGTELTVSLLLEMEDGQRVQQVSKVLGIAGPRWLLRATLFGRPAFEYREDGDVEQALRDVVVVRGSTAVPPRDALPMAMPPNARRADS